MNENGSIVSNLISRIEFNNNGIVPSGVLRFIN